MALRSKFLAIFILFASSTMASGFETSSLKTQARPDTCLPKEELLGVVDRLRERGFVQLPSEYSSTNAWLRTEAAESYMRMADSARKCGISLNVLSGFRSFDRQVKIWEQKWERYKDLPDSLRIFKILEYSMLPGASRHHWGTEVDLNSLSNAYFLSGNGRKEFEWLELHARHFGFFRPYKSRPTNALGVNEEMWHWSYYPLSVEYLKCWNGMNAFNFLDRSSFSGFQWAEKTDAFKVFANQINHVD